MSRARSKGTRGENYFLSRLRQLFFPHIPLPTTEEEDNRHPLQRAPLKGISDHGDFLGVPWLHEAKNTIKPNFQAWARICEAKAGSRWVLLWKGDLRTRTGNGPYVLMSLEMYEQLVRGTDNA